MIDFSFSDIGSKCNPTILLLHGFLGCRQDWESIVSELCRQFRCISIDLPGHGNTSYSEFGEFVGIPGCAKAVIKFLDSKGIDTCHLIGYSLGGRLALYLTLNYSKRINKVVMESGSPGLRTQVERRVRRFRDSQFANRLESENFREVLREWYEQPLFQTMKGNSNLFEALIQSRLQNNVYGLACSLRAMGIGMQPNLWPVLIYGRCPLLLIVGEKDKKFLAIAKEMAQSYPGLKIKIAKKCGHNIHFENPQFFVASVKKFFNKQ